MNYNGDERQPIVAHGKPLNFVPARVEPHRQSPVVIDAPSWVVQQQPMPIDGALMAVEGAQERTSAMDRARALRVRLMPFVALWGLLGVLVGAVVLIVAENAPGAALVGLLTFVAMTGATYVKLNGQDYAHSREGTERFKVATAAGLARQHMSQEHELRRMALDAYLATLERNEGKR